MLAAIIGHIALPKEPFWVWFIIESGAVLTALGAVYKFAFKPLKKEAIGWRHRWIEFFVKIDYITAELKPNGGNSMRDQVDYIRRLVEKVNQRQLNFFQFKPYGIIEFDPEGKCVWVNRGYLDIVQRHPEDILGNGWRNVFPEEDREQIVKEWLNCVNDGRDFMIRTNIMDREGNAVPVDIRRLAMRSDDGELLGYLGFMCHAGAFEMQGVDLNATKCLDCPVRIVPKEEAMSKLEQHRSGKPRLRK